jgi:hypothetical protein
MKEMLSLISGPKKKRVSVRQAHYETKNERSKMTENVVIFLKIIKE